MSDENRTKRCPRCRETKPIAEFALAPSRAGGHAAECKPCKAKEARDRAAKNTAKADAEAAAQAARIRSEFDALRPDDFDVSIGNDGRRDPKASTEKRQEYSRAMGETSQALHRAAVASSHGADIADAMPDDTASYIAKLAEQEYRFGNRRIARSVSLAMAGEALMIRQFKAAAREVLRDKITPTGYARKEPNATAKRSVCLLLSDLHLGSELSALDNPIPFRAIEEARRLEYVVRQLLDYKPQYRKTSEAVVMINGDIIDGLLMHDLRDGAPLCEQKVIFWKYFQAIIGLVAQQYPSVRVVCQPGNHGRDIVRHPGRATSRKWDSHEWEMYFGLREMCSSLRNVTWSIDFRAISIIDLHGSKFGLTHGDTEIKVCHPDAGAAKNAAIFDRINSTGIYGTRFDAWGVGHFHTPRYHPRTPRVIYNGALVPPNGYARTEGHIAEPCGQFLFESVEGYPIGDLRFIEVGRAQDIDERLGTLVKPYRLPTE